MIEKIALDNFKGTSDFANLTQLNIFRGTSGSGKSTWLEAVRVAILGHDPGYGKLLAETISFSSGDIMEVGVYNSDVRVNRVFSKDRSGKATQKIFINEEGMTAKAAEPLLAEHFGQFPMMLNPDEFFEMSDDKKIAFLFGLSDTETNSEVLRRKCMLAILSLYTEAVNFILEYEFDNADPFTMAEDTFANFLGKSIKKIAEKDVPAGRAITKIFSEFLTPTLPNGQATLSMYTSTLRNEINATRRAKQDAEAANRKLTEEKAEKMNLVNYNEEENKTFIEAYRQEISDIEKELHTREKFKSARERLEGGIATHEAAVAANKETVLNLESVLLSKEETKELKATTTGRYNTTNTLMEASSVAIEELKGLNEVFSKLNTVHVVPKCTTCGVNISCEKCKPPTAAKKKKTEKEIIELRARIAVHEEHINSIKSAIEASNKDHERLVAELEQQKVKLNDYVIATQHQIELEKLLVEEKKNLESLEEPGAGTETLEVQVKGLKEKLGERLVAEKNHQWLRTLAATIARSNETINNSEALLSALSVSENAVKGVRDELTQSAISPIEEACNDLLQKVDPSFNLTYDIEDGKFEIRCIGVKGKEVDFKTLSGGEKVLYLSAQLLALMAIVNPKLKILEVELGEVSGNLVPPFMKALKSMTKGTGVQVVLSSCHTDFEVEDESWSVFQMDKND